MIRFKDKEDLKKQRIYNFTQVKNLWIMSPAR